MSSVEFSTSTYCVEQHYNTHCSLKKLNFQQSPLDCIGKTVKPQLQAFQPQPPPRQGAPLVHQRPDNHTPARRQPLACAQGAFLCRGPKVHNDRDACMHAEPYNMSLSGPPR